MDYPGVFQDVKKMQYRAIYLYPALNEEDRLVAFEFARECQDFLRDCLEVIGARTNG